LELRWIEQASALPLLQAFAAAATLDLRATPLA
jgi:hypothetical protein